MGTAYMAQLSSDIGVHLLCASQLRPFKWLKYVNYIPTKLLENTQELGEVQVLIKALK